MLPLVLVVAYLLGCLSPGRWLVRSATGGDVRDVGSGRTGATNAARVLGTRGFVIVLALDAAKAAVAVLVARWLLPENAWSALALPAVVAGHIWPATLGFRGGRGAGPLLGGCIALHPLFAAASAVAAALALIWTRRTVFVTTAAAAAGTIAAFWLLRSVAARTSFVFALALVVFAHRDYFRRRPNATAG